MSVCPIVIPSLYMVVVPHASQTLPPPLLLSESPPLLSHLHLINKQYQNQNIYYIKISKYGSELIFHIITEVVQY